MVPRQRTDDVRMPRARAVFARKTKWRLPEEMEEEAVEWKDNYSSAKENPEVIQAQLDADLAAVPPRIILMSRREAERRWPGRLFVGAMAVIEEAPGKWRLLLDATHDVQVNHRIRVRDQLTSPMAEDLRATQGAMAEDGRSHFAVTADVEGAHRTVVVAEQDWGFQAASPYEDLPPGHPEETLAVNPCGTFGVNSAAYHWGRLGAMLERWLHYALGRRYKELFSALFADDLRLVSRGEHWVRVLLMCLVALQAVGARLKWKKLGGGQAYEWIGYWEDLGRFLLGISVKRRDWLLKWLEDTLERGHILVEELREVAGRFGFAFNVLEYERPFLSPVYAWVAAVPPASYLELPVMVRMVLRWFQARLRARHMLPTAVARTQVGELFRADARATDTACCVGGWDCSGGKTTKEARWFSVRILERDAPWVYGLASPMRRIAALELFATLLCLLVLLPARPTFEEGILLLSAGTDNAGNGFLLDKLMTGKFPLNVVLMEMAAVLEERASRMLLQWVPRERNEPADALSNEDFSDFDPALRVEVDLGKIRFRVLTEMMAAGTEFFGDLARAKEEAKAKQDGKRRRQNEKPHRREEKRRRLKERDPW